jgi:hypothetical protein
MNDAHSRHLEGVKKAKCSEITKKYVLQSEGRFRQCHRRSSGRGRQKDPHYQNYTCTSIL